MGRISIFGVLMLFYSLPVSAQQPLELSAEKTLEWHRDALEIIANGDVVVRQGDVEISSDQMIANYIEGQDANRFQIKKITASGGVIIKNQDGQAEGARAVFIPAQNLATLTGSDLKMTSDNYILTATEKFEYNLEDGHLFATGQATLRQKTEKGDNLIQADILSAFFKQGAENSNTERALEKMTAEGNVIITTPTEVVTGKRGTYDRALNTVTLEGGVSVKRGANSLQGTIATVDLNTNISTLSGGEGRVTGTFYPQ